MKDAALRRVQRSPRRVRRSNRRLFPAHLPAEPAQSARVLHAYNRPISWNHNCLHFPNNQTNYAQSWPIIRQPWRGTSIEPMADFGWQENNRRECIRKYPDIVWPICRPIPICCCLARLAMVTDLMRALVQRQPRRDGSEIAGAPAGRASWAVSGPPVVNGYVQPRVKIRRTERVEEIVFAPTRTNGRSPGMFPGGEAQVVETAHTVLRSVVPPHPKT